MSGLEIIINQTKKKISCFLLYVENIKGGDSGGRQKGEGGKG
jgi:hypothetical protein